LRQLGRCLVLPSPYIVVFEAALLVLYATAAGAELIAANLLAGFGWHGSKTTWMLRRRQASGVFLWLAGLLCAGAQVYAVLLAPRAHYFCKGAATELVPGFP